MSDNKKYYYLKLKDNYFDSEDMRILESMANGYKYSNILLKLYLKSLKKDGLLMFKDYIPYDAEMIATITNHNINDVREALRIFVQMKYIEILSDGAIYMMDIQNYIGTSSSEADRIRLYRNQIKSKKSKLLSNESSTNVQQKYNKCTALEKKMDKQQEEIVPIKVDIEPSVQMNNKSTTKVHQRTELELELELNNNNGKEENENVVVEKIQVIKPENIQKIKSISNNLLTENEIALIFNKTNTTKEKFIEKLKLLTESTTEIKNIVGYLIHAINNDYKANKIYKSKKVASINQFHNFERSKIEYTNDELIKKINRRNK